MGGAKRGACTLELEAPHAVSPAVVARMGLVVGDDGVSELVKSGSVLQATDSVGGRSTVPLQQVGARVIGKRGTIVALTIAIVEASVAAWSRIVSRKDALSVRTGEHPKGTRVAHVTVHLPRACITFNARGSALAIEAHRVGRAFLVPVTGLSILLCSGGHIHGRHVKTRSTDAHDIHKPWNGPQRGVSCLVVQALVVPWQASILKPRATLQSAAILATRGGLRVGGLVV